MFFDFSVESPSTNYFVDTCKSVPLIISSSVSVLEKYTLTVVFDIINLMERGTKDIV